MGYPRKSYPHRCPPPCAKRSRPRACARVYIIYRSPVGRSRGVSAPLRKRVRAVVPPCPAPPCAGWGRAKAKVDAPSRRAPHFPCLRPRTCPLMSESLCAKAECTRQSPLLPVRSPRVSLSTAAPLPADGRSAERKGGSAQGNPRSCPCVLPATACLRPCSRPLMGVAPCVLPASARLRPCTLPADGRSAVRPPRFSPPKTAPPPTDGRSAERRVGEGEGKGGRPLAQQPALSPPTAPPPPPKWAPRLRRREGKRPNGAPPHHNAHTPNAARKRYLHNSRTKTQRRTKRCAQFVFFVFTPCKLLHNFSTVLHRSPREVPKRAQIAARRPDFPCFTARFSPFPPESHCAKHPRTAPVLPPHRPRSPPEKRPASRLREIAPAPSRPRNATTRHDLRILHVFSEIRTNRRPAEN